MNFLILFCLAVLFWSLSGNAYMELKKQPPSTTFQNVGSLLAEDYEPMLRSEAQAKDPLPFTMWTQSDNQRLEGLGTGRVQNVSWLAIKGDTRLLLPVMQTLFEDDTDGCLIDQATAKQLFRNNNAVGNTVKMGGKEYIVRGVIDGPARTMITQLARESGHILSNITVSGTDNTETFLMRHGLSAAITVKTNQYVSLARILYMLPALAVILVSMMLLGLLRRHWKAYQVRHLLLSVGMLSVGTASLLLLFTFIPETLIPSQWSDFEFWETAGRDFIQIVVDFISSAKYRPDLGWLYGVFKSASGVLSAHFVMCLYNLFRIHLSGNVMIRLRDESVHNTIMFEHLENNQKVLQDVN